MKTRDFLHFRLGGLHQVAIVLASSAVCSQVLALVRDRIFATLFGTGRVLDIYYAAFKIPDLLFATVGSLASIAILIPFFMRERAKSDQAAREMLDSVFSFFTLVVVLSALILFFLLPVLAHFVAPGFDATEIETLIWMSRILLLSPIFLGISGLFSGITQSFNKFFAYALSPIFYNLGIIFGALFLYKYLGNYGLAWGVVLGALGHALVQWPVVVGSGFRPRLSIRIRWPLIREMLLTSIPRTLTLSVYQIAIVIITSLGSILSVGSIAVFNFAFNLQSVPLAVIGVSYSLAAFPTLSRFFMEGERMKFLAHLSESMRHIIFWSLPISALFIVLRAQIVRVILGSGAFDWTSTRLTAAVLAIFAISIVAQSIVLLFVRAYYASGNTKEPLIANIISFFIIISSAPILLYLFRTHEIFRNFIESLLRVEGIVGTEVLMLPLAYSIGLVINACLHWWMFLRAFPEFRKIFTKSTMQAFCSAVLVGFVAHLGLELLDNIFNIRTLPGIFAQGFLAGLVGIISGFILLRLLKNEELPALTSALHQKFWRLKPTLPSPEEQQVI